MELSVLIPVKNIESEIAGILRFAAKQSDSFNAEYIIVDMGSEDKTVLQAVLLMKELGLHGFVIQNGNSPVAAALNTAVQKSGGEYLTFLFARRLYEGFYRQYMETAKRSAADLVFGCANKDEQKIAERRIISSAVRRPDGAWFAKDMLRRGSYLDIAAVFVRRRFLLDKEITFSDSFLYGYAEEFLFRCLLAAGTVVQAPALLVRNETCELKRGKKNPAGFRIFQRVEAALHVLGEAKSNFGKDGELIRLIEKEKIPLTVMNAVDIILREGVGRQAVKNYLEENGYDKLLSTDRKTNAELRRRILLWKTVPWLYRP